MAAHRQVYDSRHLQADYAVYQTQFTRLSFGLPRTGISSGTLRSAIEYWLPLLFYF